MNYCKDCLSADKCPILNRDECHIGKLWDGYYKKIAELQALGVKMYSPSTLWSDGELQGLYEGFITFALTENNSPMSLQEIQDELVSNDRVYVPLSTLYQAMKWADCHYAKLTEVYDGKNKRWFLL